MASEAGVAFSSQRLSLGVESRDFLEREHWILIEV